VLEDFKQALARVQSDYGFYVDCQANPAVALAGYDLSVDERSALTDPEKLGGLLRGGIGISRIPSITIKISGTHDWVNRTRPKKTTMSEVDLDAKVATEVEAIKKASTDEARTGAAVRLMELIG
jgi:hypothetical protein